ncbi:hypothetical protein LTR86_006873 [Recurvomyces mirabilis]|nr:hypothetical protein LTR86_006873 [Recurvomyces mirabilis]
MVTGRQYAYQCPICIFSHGHAEGRTWKGTNIFLDHVSTHRGKEISSEVLHKLNIINEYVADDKENFDLNLYPPGFDSKSSYGSSESSLTLSRAPTHTSVLEKVWGRKDSTAPAAIDTNQAAHRGQMFSNIRERSDSVVPGAEKDGVTRIEHVVIVEPWSAGLSEFHKERDIDYLSEEF